MKVYNINNAYISITIIHLHAFKKYFFFIIFINKYFFKKKKLYNNTRYFNISNKTPHKIILAWLFQILLILVSIVDTNSGW